MFRLLSAAWLAAALGLVSVASAHEKPSASFAMVHADVTSGPDKGLFLPPPRDASPAFDREPLPPTVARRRVVQIDIPYLQAQIMPRIVVPASADQPKRVEAPADAVRLNFFADAAVDAVAERIQHTLSGDVVWQGRLADGREGQVHLVVSRGRVTGSIAAAGAMFEIYPDKNGNTVVDQIDPRGFPKVGSHPMRDPSAGDKPTTRAFPWTAPAEGFGIVGDPGTVTTVTLVVAYTQMAGAQSADIVGEINLAVAQANTAYANSGVNIALQLVGIVAASYDEGAKSALAVIADARAGLARTGELSELRDARLAHGADLVALVVKNYAAFQACGIGYMLLNPTVSDAPYAVSAMMRGSCLASNQTLAHELGHNMGLAHDRYAVRKYNEGPWRGTPPQDHDYFGYVDANAGELTVMSYFDACTDARVSCWRTARFSNPDRAFGNGDPSGVALGRPNPANNARVLNANKDIVARWRPTDPGEAVLTVGKAGTGGGRVASSPAAISCGSVCSTALTLGATVTLTAMPASGSFFAGWTGACSGIATTASVTVSGDVSCTATFTLSAATAPPANDSFASAAHISGASGTATGSNVNATKDAGEPIHAGNRGGKSVWWSWTPTVSGFVTIATTGSSFDTVLAVYTGTSVGALSLVAANDDSGRSCQSMVGFNAVAGTTYSIAVDGYDGAFGSIALKWTESLGSAPANDSFAGAVALTRSSGTVSGSNRFASKQAGEPVHAGKAGGASVWWKITPNRSRRVRLSTAGSSFDTTLAVYAGSAVDALAPVAAADDSGNTPQSAVSFMATAGITYYVAVDGHDGAAGSIVLSYSGGPSSSLQVDNGWWWSPAQPGSGIAIEQSGDQLYVGAYLYDAAGRPIWYSAIGRMESGVFTGQLIEYADGQTLTGAYRPAAVRRVIGTMTIAFTGDTTATLTWPGGTMAIRRFDIVTGGVSGGGAEGDPETGWWWCKDEPGRAYFIEAQGSNRATYVGGYMYDADGQAVWYVASGNLRAGPAIGGGLSFTGSFAEYADGQTLGGAWRQPGIARERGRVTIQFTGTRDAVMTQPDGRQVTLTRFAF